jgi:hypothetical protein
MYCVLCTVGASYGDWRLWGRRKGGAPYTGSVALDVAVSRGGDIWSALWADWGWSHGRPTVSHGLYFQGKLTKKKSCRSHSLRQGTCKNKGGIMSHSGMFVTAAAFYRRKGFFFFAVMQASFTVEKTLRHWHTRSHRAPCSLLSSIHHWNRYKNLYPLYTVY